MIKMHKPTGLGPSESPTYAPVQGQTKIAVWPNGDWCYPGEVGEYIQWHSDDFEILEVAFDDNGEPLLPPRFAQWHWK